MSRLPFWFAAVLVAVDSAPAPAQLPSPLELARGLREQGMSDLALELLNDLEAKPLPPEQKAAIPLERAKAQLDAADEEPDEGARTAMIAEAKEGFTSFLRTNPDHPRAPEASMSLARLVSLEAKAQLARAKRLDPAESDDEGQQKKKEEAAKARPLFKVAANRFGDAAAKIEARLKEPNLDAPTRRLIERDVYEADLSRGVNQFSMADTYIRPTPAEKLERDTLLKEAYALFAKLAKGPPVVRTVWVARAWMAECDFERDRNAEAEAEFKLILATNMTAADDGKKMVRFFQLRRGFVQSIGNVAAMQTAAAQARTWLATYDSARRPTPESVATKFYLALNLQLQAEASSPVAKNAKGPPPPVTGQARSNMEAAEKLYRVISQSDNDYTTRAAKRRMQVVRRLLGEADKPPADYKTFEESQMASLIQMSKLADAEAAGATDAEMKARRLKVVALLERARQLITPKEMKESGADVADALVRLIYFYQVTDQPFQAAVLGEHLARTLKVPGGKPALAGVMGLNGYATAAASMAAGPGLDEARKADRERGIRLGRFLDEKYATDTATDRARHRLAGLLMEEGRPVEAYDVLMKVRAGYDGITGARLLQGAVAYQLLAPADSPLADDRKKSVFRKTVAELEKTVKPEPTAAIDDIRGYVNTRCRLALMHLLQSRVDPEAEKAGPGFVKAQKLAEDVAAAVPSFPVLVDEKDKKPTLDGMEMTLLAEDARARAVYLYGRSLLDQGKSDEAFGAINDMLTQMKNFGPYYTDEMKRWQSGGAAPMTAPVREPGGFFAELPFEWAGGADAEVQAEKDAGRKARVATLADGVDKTRRNVIVLAVKARVKQGQVDKAAELIDLLKSFGGSVEANIPVLQQLSVELSGQIRAARAEGRAEEAKTLTEGFTKLLDKLSAEPNLPAAVQLFIGQSLNGVGEHGRAVGTLKKVPDPGPLLTTPQADLTPEQRQAVAVFRVATLHLARALRGAKQYKEADALLTKTIGTPEKQGWGYTSLDYRKEVAYLLEAQGADEADVKAANKLWGQAQQQWNSLFGVARKRLTDAQNQLAKETADPPPPGAPRMTGAQVIVLKNAYYEAFFDVNRCVVKANSQLLKGNPKLQATMTSTATKFLDIEKLGGAEISADVHNKYADLLNELPELKKAYQAAGGKMFLERAGTQ